MECSTSEGRKRSRGLLREEKKKETGLLDLADALLLEILATLGRFRDLGDVVRFGAVCKRFNHLHFLVSRIETSIETENEGYPPNESMLHHFLTSLVQKGGCLRELHLWLMGIEGRKIESLEWLEPVSGTLHSLGFYVWCPWEDEFGDSISRCAMLVKLCIDSEDYISTSQVELIVTSCTKLRDLSVLCIDLGDLKLTSSSLEKAELAVVESATFNTPALKSLCIHGEALSILSHSLERRLQVHLDSKSFQISPRLASLECLEFGYDGDFGLMEEVLASFNGGSCVDDLRLKGFVARDVSMNLATFLAPLARVRSLELSEDFMEALVRSTGQAHDETLKRLGVEKMVVGINVFNDVDVEAQVHYQNVSGWMLLLRSFLSSSSLRKLVIDCRHLERVIKDTRNELLTGCRRALKVLIESLEKEFPGVVTVLHRTVSIR